MPDTLATYAQRAAAASRMRRWVGFKLRELRAVVRNAEETGTEELFREVLYDTKNQIRLLEGVLAAGREKPCKTGETRSKKATC